MVYGRDTAYSSGVRVAGAAAGSFTGHETAVIVCPPGSWTITPTWVGAVSAGTMMPGQASNSAAIVRYRGLKFGFRRPGMPGSLPTKR